ncbi:MAG: hypothetical protein IKI45_10730 [Oscillospiraceae bacterium]|nr:hypothetical protein [Oscillospiraceae bacterium]
MFIKPKSTKPMPKPPNPMPKEQKENRKPDLTPLSRDHVLAHKTLKILSMEYVIEHGIDWEDDEIGFDEANFYYVCDLEGLFTGLLYEIYDNGNLMSYAFYKDGLKDGVEVKFYPSGKIHYYSVFCKGIITGRFYEWYENGMIKKYIDRRRKQNRRIEADEQGNITKQGKAD